MLDIGWVQLVFLLDTMVLGIITQFNTSDTATHISETAAHTFLVFSLHTQAKKKDTDILDIHDISFLFSFLFFFFLTKQWFS